MRKIFAVMAVICIIIGTIGPSMGRPTFMNPRVLLDGEKTLIMENVYFNLTQEQQQELTEDLNNMLNSSESYMVLKIQDVPEDKNTEIIKILVFVPGDCYELNNYIIERVMDYYS